MALPSRTNLDGEWMFNTKTTAETNILDGSANGEHLTAVSAPAVVDGVLGNALTYDGSADYCHHADSTAFDYDNTDAFSIEFWFKTDETGTVQLVGKQDTTANVRGYSVYMDASAAGKLNFVRCTDDANSKSDVLRTTGAYNDDEWHHVVATCAGGNGVSNMDLYVDGDDVATTDESNTLDGTISNSVNLQVAGRNGATLIPDAEIDCVRVWSVELSAAEVTSLYNSGSGAEPQDWLSDDLPARANVKGEWGMDEDSGTNVPDYSGNGLTGTAVNTPTWADGKVGNCLSFAQASAEHVEFGNNLGYDKDDAFTLECWVKAGAQSANAVLIGKTNDGDDAYELYLLSSGKYFFRLRHGNNDQIQCETDAATFEDDQWHHVVARYDGSEVNTGLDIWVDGVDVPCTRSETISSSITNADEFTIGARDGGGAPFDGELDNVRVYDIELTDANIVALYNGGLGIATWGQTEPTIYAAYNFSEGSGADVCDNSGNSKSLDVIGSPEWVQGRRGTGLNFTKETGEYLKYSTNTTDFNFEYNEAWSIEVWTSCTSFTTVGIIAGRWQNSTPNKGYGIFWSGTGSVDFALDSGATQNRIITDDDFDDGYWHHIVCTKAAGDDASDMTIYVDGVAVDTSVVTDTLNASVDYSQNMNFMARDNGYYTITGQLDLVRCYEVELSHAQVLERYNEHLGDQSDATSTCAAPPAGGKAKKIGFGSKALNNRYTPIRK